ncbi:uncharacterized protein LOC129969036 [Argiope bruennichi]|uniref:uncharacterized protein LOC129969036 n=1 Tax=Argiope bruennichi TaxID=94029 RepID=UPI0024953E38|nr:uncharacterized protein LOC129969036 [Argiope bruennichi]
MDHFFPGKTNDDEIKFNYTPDHSEALDILDLELVFGSLKSGKAPGLDKIDYRMWRAVFNIDKDFKLDIFNLCFYYNYFPECLRNGRVFFLLKNGKDPALCSSYRPVCLLSTLGKILERLFLIKLNQWLDRNKILHDNQFGFREGRSCDLAIDKLIDNIKSRVHGEHLALISLDIKSAFDNMNWLLLVVGGRTSYVLSDNVNTTLATVHQKLTSIKLRLSIEKCQAIVFRSLSSRKFSERNSTTLNRKPTYRIDGNPIKIGDSLKILGITIDNKLTWTANILTLTEKALNLTSNFNREIQYNWSLDNKIIKFWYNTVIEKALLYGSSIWGGDLTKAQISRLHTIQWIFLIRFTRAYRTTSTNLLNVVTGCTIPHASNYKWLWWGAEIKIRNLTIRVLHRALSPEPQIASRV